VSDTPSPSLDALSSLEQPQGPLLPNKPLREMTDEELQAFHSRLRQLQSSHQTRVAALRSEAAGPKKQSKKQQDFSEYE